MPLDLDDTIAAIASPPGPAERGIIRVSGTDVPAVVGLVFDADSAAIEWARTRIPRRYTGTLTLPAPGIPLPTALLWWPTARSYTGQPMAEFHTIGSPPLLDAVLERLYECGARPANPGEFTMRAFLAGRIDLVQAEGVLGVIDAADHEQLKTALTQLGGDITRKLVAVRQDILQLLGDLEAGLDFVEEDIQFITKDQIVARLQHGLSALNSLATDAQLRLPSGHRRRVVLAGLPNAGKSTLFNRLLGRQTAIVSASAGTTRDYLSATLRLGDTEVELIDTAGWEVTSDAVMQQAQRQRAAQLQSSDIILWCTAADLPAAAVADNNDARQLAANLSSQVVDLTTRCDLAPAGGSVRHPETGEERCDVGIRRAIHVSASTGNGIAELLEVLSRLSGGERSTKSELLSSTAARCRDSLQRTTAAIRSAIAAASSGAGDEIVAVELRDSLHQLAVILGEVYTDDILDHIFSHFCIGK